MPLFIKCKDAAAFIIAREDRPLTTRQSVNLKVHFLMCEACCHFEQQILTMRKVMRHWGSSDPSSEIESKSSVNDS